MRYPQLFTLIAWVVVSLSALLVIGVILTGYHAYTIHRRWQEIEELHSKIPDSVYKDTMRTN